MTVSTAHPSTTLPCLTIRTTPGSVSVGGRLKVTGHRVVEADWADRRTGDKGHQTGPGLSA